MVDTELVVAVLVAVLVLVLVKVAVWANKTDGDNIKNKINNLNNFIESPIYINDASWHLESHPFKNFSSDGWLDTIF